MGISLDFADNVVYGASDLNAVRCALATKGVLPEAETSCKVVPGSEESTVKVCAGQALFADGSHCAVDFDGVTVVVESNCYIYLSREENGAAVRTSAAVPTGGNTVLLAQAAVSGGTITLTDRREYTVLKIPSCTVNTYDEFILKKNFNDAAVKVYDPDATLTRNNWYKVHEFAVSNKNYRYVCLFDNAESLSDKDFLAWGNLDTGKYWCMQGDDDDAAIEYGIDEVVLDHALNGTKRIKFVKEGAKIGLYYKSTFSGNLNYYFDAQIKFA